MLVCQLLVLVGIPCGDNDRNWPLIVSVNRKRGKIRCHLNAESTLRIEEDEKYTTPTPIRESSVRSREIGQSEVWG
jgi:hypothetical protein